MAKDYYDYTRDGVQLVLMALASPIILAGAVLAAPFAGLGWLAWRAIERWWPERLEAANRIKPGRRPPSERTP